MTGVTAIYARQSVDKKDSLSIEGQIGLCRRVADGETEVFADRGYSGKNIRRPAFTELMRAVEGGKVTKILVYRLDRFSRSIADFSRLWETLEKHGVAFQSVTEHFDTASPIGRAMLNIVLVFAQLERETTAERVRDNYIHRFGLGAWPGGPAPYGFELTKITDGGRSVSALRAGAQADAVRDIFRAYAETDVSLRQLAERLTARGLPGPKRPEWDGATLSRILRSPLYVRADADVRLFFLSQGVQTDLPPEAFDGIHACNLIGRRDRGRGRYNAPDAQKLTAANHEGIVDSALWLRVQDRLAHNAQLSRENAGKHSYLTGLLKCAECGYAVKINLQKDGRCRLLCSGRSNLRKCQATFRIDLRELEEAVAARIQTLLDACPAQEAAFPGAGDAEALLRLDRKIETLVRVLPESGEGAASSILREIERLHAQRDEITAKAAKLPNGLPRPDFSSATFAEKKRIASQFIRRIELMEDGANIFWAI